MPFESRKPIVRRSSAGLVFASLIGAQVTGCDAQKPQPSEEPTNETVTLTEPPRRPGNLAAAARTWLPASLDQPAALEDPESGVAIRFRPEPRVSNEGLAVGPETVHYAGVFGGKDLWLTASAKGIEDYVSFEERPQNEELTYQIDLTRVAGVRLVGGVVELLDESGTPRLRVAKARVVDANGVGHRASLSVDGCALDTSPKAPWRRAVVDPGSASCLLHVSWQLPEGAYPAVVDPSWETTGAMISPREGATACQLPNGGALIVGGYDFGIMAARVDTELFDSLTRTFAAGPVLVVPRQRATCTALPNGSYLIEGGEVHPPGPPTADHAELYDPNTGIPAAAAMPPLSRRGHSAVRLDDGRVLFIGGVHSLNQLNANQADIYDSATDSWSSIADALSFPRHDNTATLLQNGRVLVVGGIADSNGLPTSSVESFDPNTKASTVVASLATGRSGHSANLLASGRVLVAGGKTTTLSTSSAEIYDPAASTWTEAEALPRALQTPGYSTLDLDPILAGGADELGPRGEAVRYMEATGHWLDVGSLGVPRSGQAQVTLTTGEVLVAGGSVGPSMTTSEVELLRESALGQPCSAPGQCVTGFCGGVCCSTNCHALGQTCSNDSECASQHCADGVCCSETCGGSCEACNGPNTLGTCTPVLGAPLPGHPACPSGLACGGLSTECSSGVNCNGDHIAIMGDGTQKDCAPFACGDNGQCRTTCSSVTDCATPFVCDTTSRCVKPDFTPPKADCALTQDPDSGAALTGGFVIVTLTMIAGRRRRRACG